jgi:hypothetical protein
MSSLAISWSRVATLWFEARQPRFVANLLPLTLPLDTRLRQPRNTLSYQTKKRLIRIEPRVRLKYWLMMCR